MCEKFPEQNEEAEKEDEMAKLREKLLKLFEDDDGIRSQIKAICNSYGSDESTNSLEARIVDLEDQLRQKIIKLGELEASLEKKDIYIKEQESDKYKLQGNLDKACKDIDRFKELAKDLDEKCSNLEKRVISEDLISLLKYIHSDDELIRRFELPADPEVSAPDFLLAAVAVFAQSNNFKRLWELYKDRCVDQKGPLEDADLKVLRTALAWLNANWPTKPYTLYSPVPGEGYDYEKHMRSPGANSGDKIQAIWLPGVIELKLKTLVATH